jgi:tetrahydromethanopterin S-methyltransferase subunit C
MVKLSRTILGFLTLAGFAAAFVGLVGTFAAGLVASFFADWGAALLADLVVTVLPAAFFATAGAVRLGAAFTGAIVGALVLSVVVMNIPIFKRYIQFISFHMNIKYFVRKILYEPTD